MPEVSLIPIEEFERAMIEAAERALHDAAEDLKKEAVEQAPESPTPYKWYHPAGSQIGPRGGRYDWVLPGRLKASGRVSPEEGVKRDGDEREVAVVFGNEEVQYAAVQHERLDFRHTIGKAKYLEDPLKTFRTRLPEKLAEEVKAAIEIVGKTGKVSRSIE